ncbi:Putative phage terminase, small subunit, P27 family [uncultured Caudovirales phage]|uniref:Phage terminase, small subunit, P27 family n=1 Tax=uncultured Caudovirales phage TaxID=2100421 RepID=A0A6J5S267_9CAUD|nr:Putative phage terminase, small subunit, P27 family [uncultured Caudovirales phage]CAB4200648.1 Putative phage terminase, small subunit, P27 family [uncultured Caudovirales phage]
MNKLPPELHIVKGSKGLNQGESLPDSIKARIPKADWLDDPESWDRNKFITETSDFLFNVYGIGNDQDKHALAFLAEQIDTYLECKKSLAKTGIIARFNAGKTIGPNPYLTVRQNTLKTIIQLMNELGLTPRGRLNSGKVEENSPVSKFLRGPKG